MSSQSLLVRKDLNARQVETVERLLAAAADELRDVGHEALTIRGVASRARLSAATAYTYVSSKDRLFAELFWRLLSANPVPGLVDGPPAARLRQTTRHLTAVIAGSPAMAAAATKSLLGNDPQVQHLRPRIGAVFVDRFRTAMGDAATRRVLPTFTSAFFGVLLQAGMGFIPFEELSDRLDDVVAVIMEGAE